MTWIYIMLYLFNSDVLVCCGWARSIEQTQQRHVVKRLDYAFKLY